MKKLKLNLSELDVESFQTAKLNKKTGTIKGNDIGKKSDLICIMSDDDLTCDRTCVDECTTTETNPYVCQNTKIDLCNKTQISTCNGCTDILCNPLTN